MKKVLKNISRVLFSLLLIVSIFGTFNVLAETVIFQITKIEVKEKSDKVTVNDVSLSGGQLKNDIVFTEKDDYIKYNITIKNATSDEYTIKSISDDNTSPYLEYTYDDLSNVKLESGEEKIFELQIKYIQETDNLTISDQAVSLTLTYEKVDGTTGSETITNPDNDNTNQNTTPTDNGEVKGSTETITNPKTEDNITTYIILGIISLIGLAITTVSRKHLSKSLIAITIFSMIVIPFGVKADSNKFLVTFSTNKIENSYSELVTGKDFFVSLYEVILSGDNFYGDCDDNYCEVYDSEGNYMWVDDLLAIKPATDSQYNDIKNDLIDRNLVSDENSNVPAYIWYDEDTHTLYYYSIAKKITMNEDCSAMFSDLYSLKEIDLSGFDSSKVKNMEGMFQYLNLTKLDLSPLDTSNVENMSYMFNYVIVEDGLDLSSLKTGNVKTMKSMFKGTEFTSLDLSKFDTKNVIDMSEMFYDCQNLTELNVKGFNTSNVEDVSEMFGHCENLTTLDLSSFNTKNVINFNRMFYYCTSLIEVDVDGFDTSNAEDLSEMFFGCISATKIDVSEFITKKVKDMSYMFCMCESITELDVSSFDTSKVEDMSDMFSGCISLTELDVSNFDTSNVEDMNSMFSALYNITSLDLSNFNTEKVKDMTAMFYMHSYDYTNVLTELNLSSFDTSKVENMREMFRGANNLTTIYVSDKFVTNKVSNSNMMFASCNAIKGENNTVFDIYHIDKSYAHIDGGPSNPGYFTDIANKPQP